MDAMENNELRLADVPLLIRPPKSPQNFFALSAWYFLPSILLTFLWSMFAAMRIFHPFQAIRFIYLTNVLILPLLYLGWLCWKLVLAKFTEGGLNIWEIVVKAGLSLTMLAIFGYATILEPQRIQVEEIAFASPKIAGAVKILHLSDIQTQAVGRYEQKVFALIRQLNPDLIIHTGDLIEIGDRQQRERELQKLAVLFKQLKPQYGIYCVIGDTDRFLQNPQKMKAFEELSGAKILLNESILITIQTGQFRLLGLAPNDSRFTDNAFITHWQNSFGKEAFSIIMGHAPDYILNLQDMDIDLCLAGHTHGGQVRLPFWGALVTLSDVPRAWAMGYHTINKLRFNVSAGIGVEHQDNVPPMRFNCPPTMTLLQIN